MILSICKAVDNTCSDLRKIIKKRKKKNNCEINSALSMVESLNLQLKKAIEDKDWVLVKCDIEMIAISMSQLDNSISREKINYNVYNYLIPILMNYVAESFHVEERSDDDEIRTIKIQLPRKIDFKNFFDRIFSMEN